MGDLGMDEDRPYLPSFAAPLNNPDPNSIRVEAWVLAEDPTREVLNCIHPTLDSEEKRKDVIEFVQKLIRCNLRLEVFPYGSVPLKSYLPDGDIDLTVLSTPNLDEILPREVLRVLQEEEQNGNTEFEIKDTQFIDAEVKLVKCLVQDIVIDISFNQLGGLCTLCFLEQVDRLAGKDHLFKRSIIIIKAWCYYESRILGAHHGLISTYALETLVLYIFHVFYSSLNGPIEVLYRFLDYYAKFDWENYCVSLDGPVCKSSLPNLAVENSDNQGTDVLLGAEFRKNCMDMFIVPSKGPETDPRAFFLKNLNIIDPLKENNNLGRSVNRGNYYRIQSAFRYGARRLGKILQLPNNNKIGDEIKMFFRNTLQRHRPKYGSDNTFIAGVNGLHTLSISSRSGYEDDIYSRFSNGGFDDYINDESINLSLENDHNTPPHNNSVDGDMICVCIDNKENQDILSESELLDPFSDLTGDYDAHIRNLLYGQGCHGHAMSTNMVRASPSPSPPTSPYEKRSPWDPVAHSWPKVNTNGVVMGPTHNGFVNGNKRATGHVAGRGTGPYIPVMRCNTCKDRTGPTRGRGRAARMQPHSNGHWARGRSVEPKLVIEVNNHSTQFPLEWSPKKAQVNARSTQTNPTPVKSTINGNGNGNVTNHTHENPNPVNSTVNGNGNVGNTHKNPNPVNSTVNGNGNITNLTHKNPNPVNSTVNGNGNVTNLTHKNPNPVNSTVNGNGSVTNHTHKNPNPVNSTVNGNGNVGNTHKNLNPVNSTVNVNGNVGNTHKNPNPVNSTVNGNGSVTNHTHKNLNPVNSTVNVNGNVGNTHKNPNPVNSAANGNVSQPRKLEFGSFRSIADVNGRKQERNGENSFHLKNEDEFPPLSSA